MHQPLPEKPIVLTFDDGTPKATPICPECLTRIFDHESGALLLFDHESGALLLFDHESS